MRRFTVLCFLSVFMCVIFAPRAWADVEINETNFPDANFRSYVSENIDENKDGYLSDGEIAAVTDITVREQGISNLKGIEYFTALTNLTCDTNQLKELDVSKNTALEYLYCDNNQLTALNVSKNAKLTYLSCYSNNLAELDVSSSSTALQTLYCDNNQLTALDVSSNPALTYLSCHDNQLTELDVSNNKALEELLCYSNQLTALDVSKNSNLSNLECYSNQLTALDVSSSTALKYLECYSNQLTALDVSKNTALEQLYCSNNKLTALDVSNNSNLSNLECDGQNTSGSNIIYTGDATYPYEHIFSWDISADKIANISSVSATSYEGGIARFSSRPSTVTYNYATGYSNSVMDVTLSGLSLFIEINKTIFPDEKFRAYVSNNFDSDKDGYLSDEEIKTATNIDVSRQGISNLKGIEHFTALTTLNCSENQLATLDLSNNTKLTSLSCGGQKVSGYTLIFTGDSSYPYEYIFSRDISADKIANIASVTAKDSSDAAITVSYADGTAHFASLPSKVTYNYATGKGNMDVTISGMAVKTGTGIFEDEKFRAYVSGNFDSDKDGYLSDEEMTAIKAATDIDVSGQGISSLKGIEYFTALTTLNCSNNQLTALDLSSNTALTTLNCSNNTALTTLDCSNNKLTAIDLSGNTALTALNCSNNQLATLDLSSNTALTALDCSSNQLSALDLSKNTGLSSLNCESNSITELDIRNCANLKSASLKTDSNIRITHGSLDRLPSFGKHSLILSGQLGLDFYANIPASINTDGAYTNFTVNSKTGSPEMFSSADKVGDYYRFTCYINSVQMADTITAKFCYSQDKRDMAAAQDYTVTDYLDTIISSEEIKAKSPDLVALAEAIKDYGHYVQIPLADFNNWKIGTDHAEIECVNQNIDSDSADVKTKLGAYKHNKNIEGSGIESLMFDLELESETTLNIYLTPGNDAGNVSAYITDDDNEFDGKTNMAVYKPSENVYVVTISGISAHKLGKVYTVSITTSKGSGFTVKMSALSYANAIMQSENDGGNIDDDLKRAVISLYKYYVATMKYRDPTFTE